MEGVALLNIVSNDLLGKVVLPIPILDSAGLEILVPKGLSHNNSPIDFNYGCLPVTLGCLY